MKHLLKVVGEPTLIHHEATEKHGEVTIAIVTYALKLVPDLDVVPTEVFEKIDHLSNSIPEYKINRNYHPDGDVLFTVKGKTIRRNNDTHNQELADKIALAKCGIKACKLSRRILRFLYNYYIESCFSINKDIDSLLKYEEREKKYVQKM
jgi:hypothetical protein